MVESRYDTIGIKQVIRLEWLEKTVNLLLAGFDAQLIRQELFQYLSDQSIQIQSEETRSFSVTILMKTWVTPDIGLSMFRDKCLSYLHNNPSASLAIHWGMVSAAYPFWFNVAKQIGRLLSLQDKITQTQIIKRLKEKYGDRQTISRYSKYVIRSFVDWGVLKDADKPGCYLKGISFEIDDPHISELLFEAALHTLPEGRSALAVLKSNPGLFPFKLPIISSGSLSQTSKTIEIVRHGLDEDLVRLKNIGLFNEEKEGD